MAKNKATMRDLIAVPFMFLSLFFMFVAIEIGKSWTAEILLKDNSNE